MGRVVCVACGACWAALCACLVLHSSRAIVRASGASAAGLVVPLSAVGLRGVMPPALGGLAVSCCGSRQQTLSACRGA